MSQRLALLIGHTTYQDNRLAVPHAAADVAALADALRDRQHGRFDHVLLLQDKTAVDAQLAIAAFLEQELASGDLVLIYFAGHCLFDGRDVFLAAADTFTEPYLDATTIQAEFIQRRLNQCPAQQLVIVDYSHSRLDGSAESDPLGKLARALGGPHRALFLAAQPATATAPSTFTQTLVQGLRRLAADSDEDGRLTIAEWFAFAQTAATSDIPNWQKWSDTSADQWAVTAVSRDKLNPLPLTPLAVGQPPATAPSPAPAPPGARRAGLIATLLLILLLLAVGWYGLRGNVTLRQATSPATATAALVAVAPTRELPTDMPPTAVMNATAPSSAVTPTTTIPAPTATATTPPTSPTAVATTLPTRTAAATLPPSATPSPAATATATPLPTATTAPIPMQISAEAAFLRAGPGINYRIITFPRQGTAVTAIGRNSDATWYNIVLEDGTAGWIYTDVVRPADVTAAGDLPLAATIPAPLDEFYDFVAQDNGRTLITEIYHAYVGTRGESALLRARTLPETDQVQPLYLNGPELGLGLLIVEFVRTGSEPYTSTAVEFCMVDTAGEPFHCQTFTIRKEW